MSELRGWNCIECNQVYYARKQKRNHLCPECGIKRAFEAARQMMAKEGPYYEKWKASQEMARQRQKVASERYRQAARELKELEESDTTKA